MKCVSKGVFAEMAALVLGLGLVSCGQEKANSSSSEIKNFADESVDPSGAYTALKLIPLLGGGTSLMSSDVFRFFLNSVLTWTPWEGSMNCLYCKQSDAMFRRGFYRRPSDQKKIQRYSCKRCNKGFSEQTLADVQVDEMESFIHTKLKPVTIPIAVEKKIAKCLLWVLEILRLKDT